jgi:hypothetical protein
MDCKDNSDFPISHKCIESVVSKINGLKNPALFSNDKSYKIMSPSTNDLLYYFSFV